MGAVRERGAPGTGGALVLLYALRMKATFRRLRRSVATPKGIVFGLIGLGVIALWLGPLVLRGFLIEPGDPAEVRAFVPYALLMFLLLALVSSLGERAIYFSPAEVNLLFNGPFSRRQLVLYKIGTAAMGLVLSSLFFALFLYPQVGWFLPAYLGAFAALLLVQLVSMFVVLLGERIGQQVTARLRWIGGALFLALGGSAAYSATRAGLFEVEDYGTVFETVRAGVGPRLLEGVLAPYTWTLTAPSFGVLGLAFTGAMAINGAFVAAILWMDANYLEKAASVSERIYQNIQRAQRTGVAPVKASRARRRIPMLPHWGGVGVVAWRQLTTAARSSLGTVGFMLGVAVVFSFVVSSGFEEGRLWGMAVALVAWITLILTGILRFDFRGDLDVMESLKAMPLRPTAVAIGQIAAPTLVLTLIQTTALAVPFVVQGQPQWIPLVALLAFPVNALLYGVENLLFLLYPVRMKGQTATDFSFLGRQVLVFMVKILVVGGGVALAAGFGWAIGFATGRVAVGAAVAWLVLCAEVAALMPYLGWAYRRFDPSQDLPD